MENEHNDDTLAGDFQISDELAKELERRWEDHLANPEDCISWEEARAEIVKRLRRDQ
jgi:putative addiction module component (TIGR02574 family)